MEDNADIFARDVLIDPEHYKKMLKTGNYHDLDLMNYKNKHFRFEETRECFDLIAELFEYAKENSLSVKVNWW